jgi:hypothetical protein
MSWPDYYALDEHGEPDFSKALTLDEYMAWLASYSAGNHVAVWDGIAPKGEPVYISTRWFGMVSQPHTSEGYPCAFETMVFGGPTDSDGYGVRTASRAEALANHEAAVRSALDAGVKEVSR